MKKSSIAIVVMSIIIVALAGGLIFKCVDAANYKKDVASQYKMYKNIISQEEVEKTLFEQPISSSRNGEYRIGIKCATDGDFHAELSIYRAEDGKYNKVFSCPAVVGKNGPGKQSEGDTKTPLGTWTVGEVREVR